MSDDVVYGEISISAGGSQARMPIRGRKSRHTLVNGWTVLVEAPPEKDETVVLQHLSLEAIQGFIDWTLRREKICSLIQRPEMQEHAMHYRSVASLLSWAKQEASKP